MKNKIVTGATAGLRIIAGIGVLLLAAENGTVSAGPARSDEYLSPQLHIGEPAVGARFAELRPEIFQAETSGWRNLPAAANEFPIPTEIIMRAAQTQGMPLPDGALTKAGTTTADYRPHAENVRRLAAELNRDVHTVNAVSIHLGTDLRTGFSIAQIRNGQPTDVIDEHSFWRFSPNVLIELVKREMEVGGVDEQTAVETVHQLLEKGGLCHLSEISNNIFEVAAAARAGNQTAQFAFDVFMARLRFWIGAFAADVGTVHGVAITGELPNSFLNKLLAQATAGIFGNQPPTVMPVKTNEELLIAHKTYELLFAESPADRVILVANSGSSSFKWQLLRISRRGSALHDEQIDSGLVEKIGEKDSPIANHTTALNTVLSRIRAEHPDVKIDAVGHRVVHGGTQFSQAVVIDHAVETAIQDNIPLAPLHNPANLAGIRAMRAIAEEAQQLAAQVAQNRTKAPGDHAAEQKLAAVDFFTPQVLTDGLKQVAVFDTAFHATMDETAAAYALPRQLRNEYRRYGFHGASHDFVSQAIPGKVVTVHLGNGASLTAINDHRSLDNSLGGTFGGLIMGTRSGDLPTDVMLSLLRLGVKNAETWVSKQGGLKAGAGSNDMRAILAAHDAGDMNAQKALALFIHRLRLFIGGYAAMLRGVDHIVFTGGIGENSERIRTLATPQEFFQLNTGMNPAFLIIGQPHEIRPLMNSL